MSGPAFTPGPWDVSGEIDKGAGETRLFIGAPSSPMILASMNEVHNRAEANAHLIAAAPDMYEALELALDMLPERGGLHSPTGRLRSKLNAALAKARGETPNA